MDLSPISPLLCRAISSIAFFTAGCTLKLTITPERAAGSFLYADMDLARTKCLRSELCVLRRTGVAVRPLA